MTTDIYDIDYETRSAADLKNVGAARYAEDKSTRILMFAISKNGSDPVLWDLYDSFEENAAAEKLFRDAVASGSRIFAHNYQFEHFISRFKLLNQLGINPPKVEQWRCTASMARRASIPWGLEACAEFLDLDVQKDKAGSQLINMFSVPKKGKFLAGDSEGFVTVAGNKVQVETAWRMFCEYCRQDVRTQIAIRQKLHHFCFDSSPDTLASFQFDARLNDRGVPVNLKALKLTDKLVKDYQEKINERFFEVVGCNQSQRAKVLRWMKDGGYPAENMQAATVASILENPPAGMDADALKALKMYSLLSFAALAKIPAMIRAANSDGRVRGAFMWSGATRTGRWTGQIIQPQNMRRPTIKDTDTAYEMFQLEDTTCEDLEMLWESPLEAVASSIRHFIHDVEHDLLDVDYSNIEARILAWLSGDAAKLGKFARGIDVYKESAALVFGKKAEDITKEERFVGKVAELGLGYQASWTAFTNMLTMQGYSTPEDQIKRFASNNAETIENINKVVLSKDYKRITELVELYPLLACTFRIPKRKEPWTEKEIKAYKPKPTDYYPITEKDVAKYLQDVLAKKVVKIYRDANPKVKALWGEFDAAAKKAVKSDGGTFKVAGGKVSFRVKDVGFKALTMQLPSGRCLIYPEPEIRTKQQTEIVNGEKRTWEAEYVSYRGQLPVGRAFGRIASYGGKWVENCCQAIGGDFLSHGTVVAEKRGYETFAIIHDQALAPHKKYTTLEGYVEALCDLPEWAEGFPLAGEGGIVKYYTKD